MTEFNLFPKFIDKALTPLAEEIGGTLASLWDMSLGWVDFHGEKVSYKRQLKLQSYKRQRNLQSFKEILDTEISKIPEENLQEPQLHIVGPAFEASKYYFDNEQLRTLFAKLIASTINSEKNKENHPSFVEIIKQLSPLDAMNLELFNDERNQPIVDYVVYYDDDASLTFYHNVYLGNPKITDLDLNSISITNLKRLGLVDIDFSNSMFQDVQYNAFENTSEYKELKDEVLSEKLYYAEALATQITLDKGSVSLTPYGEGFVNVCIND